jgi:hypothetical protein
LRIFVNQKSLARRTISPRSGPTRLCAESRTHLYGSKQNWSFKEQRHLIELARASKPLDKAAKAMKRKPEAVAKVMTELKKFDLAHVMPMHCRGQNFIDLAKQEIPEKLVLCGTGTSFIFTA